MVKSKKELTIRLLEKYNADGFIIAYVGALETFKIIMSSYNNERGKRMMYPYITTEYITKLFSKFVRRL